MTEIKLGNIEVKSAQQSVTRISMLLWGSAGCGKTTLACTAPGKKLILNFDPDGPESDATRDDVLVADFSPQPASIIEQLKKEDPFGLTKLLTDNPDIETVIIDSMTKLAEVATAHAVSQVKGATIERPSLQGYGYRNAYVGQVVSNILRLTSKLNRHVIFIAHEAQPEKTDEGVVLYISLMLGGQMQESVPLQLSEVWAITDTGKERRIAIRPCRMRKPMKSRMFDTSGSPEFLWKYDPNMNKGDTIAGWWEKWQAGNFKKLAVPNG